MTPEEWVEKTVSEAPAPTAEQIEKVRRACRSMWAEQEQAR